MLLIAFIGLEAKPKKDDLIKSNLSLDKIWKEFKIAYEKSDKDWFLKNTAFPLMNTAECGFLNMPIEKIDFSLTPPDKKEFKKINSIKTFYSQIKNSETFPSNSENSIDPAKHIPNGSQIYSIGYKSNSCYVFFQFAEFNNSIKYINNGYCCEGD